MYIKKSPKIQIDTLDFSKKSEVYLYIFIPSPWIIFGEMPYKS